MLGKLRVRLSDESFRAALLLRSWHNAGLLPERGEMAQCLRDSDAAAAARRKESRQRPADEDHAAGPSKKKAKTTGGSSAQPVEVINDSD